LVFTDLSSVKETEIVKHMTPTARSLAALRKDGWTCATVERWNAYAKIRQDLFGFADVLACKPGSGIVAIQVTSGSNAAARLDKIRKEPRAGLWLASGGRILIHGWAKRGPAGSRKLWTCRVVDVGVILADESKTLTATEINEGGEK
jgi:hypothetical protein